MAITLSAAVRDARLDAIETAIGTSAILKIRSGAPPSTVATASSGTVLATLNLPSDYMSAASGGTKAKLGTWEDTSADATGTAGHFEITASNGTTVHMRGTAATSAADMILDSASFTSGQAFTVTAFTLTDANSA
jgi:hypothetical protein